MFGSVFVFALLVVGAQLGYRYLAAKRRTTAAVAATSAAGLQISPDVDEVPPLPFQMFNRGHGRKVRNRAWDPNDPNASVFDYQYTVRSGAGNDSHSRTYRQTCALYAVPFSSPNLSLSRQGFFDRIAVSFGGADVRIGNPDFDERYRVKCQDEGFARMLLDPRFVDFLMREGRAGEIEIEIAGNHVLVATGEQIPPEDFDDLLAYGRRVIAHMPSVLAERSPNLPYTPWTGQVAPGVPPAPPTGPLPSPGAVIPPPTAAPRPPLGEPPTGHPRSTPIE